MTEAEYIARKIRESLPNVKSGTLCFWGVWFGRPYDNWYQITGSDAEGDLLRIFFNEGETLSVWSPKGTLIYENAFRVNNADKIRWEWFYYGKPRTESNLYHMTFTRLGATILFTTNATWDTIDANPDPYKNAVEIF